MKNISDAKNKNFAEYDYLEVTVKNKYEALYRESYPKFGWEAEGRADAELEINAVTLSFKRSRKIPRRSELIRLQRQFETAAKEIAGLEKGVTVRAPAAGYIMGAIGAAFLAGAVIGYLAGILWLAITLAVPGIITASLSYVCYNLVRKKTASRYEPLIKEQYGEIKELTGQSETLRSGKIEL